MFWAEYQSLSKPWMAGAVAGGLQQLRLWRSVLAALLLGALLACGGGDDAAVKANPPTPDSSSPEVGPPVSASFVVTYINAKEVSAGAGLVIRGQGFEPDMGLSLNGVSVPFQWLSHTELSVQVPMALAQSGPVPLDIALQRKDGQMAQWLGSQKGEPSLLPAPVVAEMPDSAAAGQQVTMRGERLDLVKNICIRAVCSASILEATADKLVFLAPPSASGTVVLTDVYNKQHAVRSLAMGAATTISLADVQLAQAHLLSVKAAPSPYAQWVGGRDLLVRAFVLAGATGQQVKVKLTVIQPGDGGSEAAFDMTGPTDAQTAMPAANALSNTWLYKVPGHLVNAGIKLRVAVTDVAGSNVLVHWGYDPKITAPIYARLVLIPLQSAVDKPFPLLYERAWAAIRQYAQSRFPLTEFHTEFGAPLIDADNADDDTLWFDSMKTRYAAENPPKEDFYAGIGPFGTWVRGYGYIPGRVSISPFYSKQALANEDAWAINAESYVPHELAHNFGQHHIFDNGTRIWNKEYPIYSQKLGDDWPIHLNTSLPLTDAKTMRDPSTWFDIMTYEKSATASSYTYHRMHQYALAQIAQATPGLATSRPKHWPPAVSAGSGGPQAGLPLHQGAVQIKKPAVKAGAGQGAGAGDVPVLHLRGEYVAQTGQLDWRPALPSTGQVGLLPTTETLAHKNSTLVLRMGLGNGAVRWYALPQSEISHHPDGDAHAFEAVVAWEADIRQVSVYANGQQVFTRSEPAQANNAPLPYTLSKEPSGLVQLKWDKALYPYMTVVHVADGRRNALLVNSKAGEWLVPAERARTGGSLRLHLSNGVNSRFYEVNL